MWVDGVLKAQVVEPWFGFLRPMGVETSRYCIASGYAGAEGPLPACLHGGTPRALRASWQGVIVLLGGGESAAFATDQAGVVEPLHRRVLKHSQVSAKRDI